MILWLTGNTGAGKTTLAHRLLGKNTIHLDGDEMREDLGDTGLDENGRRHQNIRIAKLAKRLESQGSSVVVSVICPYEDLRREVETITGCKFIYVKGGRGGEEFPYEPPSNPVITITNNQED